MGHTCRGLGALLCCHPCDRHIAGAVLHPWVLVAPSCRARCPFAWIFAIFPLFKSAVLNLITNEVFIRRLYQRWLLSTQGYFIPFSHQAMMFMFPSASFFHRTAHWILLAALDVPPAVTAGPSLCASPGPVPFVSDVWLGKAPSSWHCGGCSSPGPNGPRSFTALRVAQHGGVAAGGRPPGGSRPHAPGGRYRNGGAGRGEPGPRPRPPQGVASRKAPPRRPLPARSP